MLQSRGRSRVIALLLMTAFVASSKSLLAQDAGTAGIAMGLTDGTRTLGEVGAFGKSAAGLGFLGVSTPSREFQLLPKYTSSDGTSAYSASFAFVSKYSSGVAFQVGIAASAADASTGTVKSFAPSLKLLSPYFAEKRVRLSTSAQVAKTIDGSTKTSGVGAADFFIWNRDSTVRVTLGATGAFSQISPQTGSSQSGGYMTTSVSLTQSIFDARIEYQPQSGIALENYAISVGTAFGKSSPSLIVSAAKGEVFSAALKFAFQ